MLSTTKSVVKGCLHAVLNEERYDEAVGYVRSFNKKMKNINRLIGHCALKKAFYPRSVTASNRFVAKVDMPEGFEADLLVATGKGVFSIRKGRLYELISGCRYHGITKIDDEWATCEINTGYAFGRVVKFRYVKGMAVEAEELKRYGQQYFHQCDYKDGKLMLVDSAWTVARERVVIVDMETGAQNIVYPSTPDGCFHMNSVFSKNGKNLVMFHNCFERSGRKSVIAEYDQEWNFIKSTTVEGYNCHNVYEEDGYCFLDSKRHALVWADKRVELPEGFSRGMAISEKSVVIGNSGVSKVREARNNLPPSLVFVDRKQLEVSHVVQLPGIGQITEIRIVGESDYSLSQEAS